MTGHGQGPREKGDAEGDHGKVQKGLHEREGRAGELAVHVQRSEAEDLGQMGGGNTRAQTRC